MVKSTLQSNLENFVCMLTQDFDFIDRDLPISTIHRLLTLISDSYFRKLTLINWTDIQSHLQQFYVQSHLDLNAADDIRAHEIESGNQKALVETLIILCSMVMIFNKDTFEEVKDYFISKIKMGNSENFFVFIDDVSQELELVIQNSGEANQSSMGSQMTNINSDTQNLLNIITDKNNLIQKLQGINNELDEKVEVYKKEIQELNSYIGKNEDTQEESKRNLIKQEKIYESKLKIMEEDMIKSEQEYERRIKKMLTNNDLEMGKIKIEIKDWKEELLTNQKESKKLTNEKKILEKNIKIKNMDIQQLKKENQNLKNQINKLEIKNKSANIWKGRYDDLKKENINLKNRNDEIEARLMALDGNYLNESGENNIESKMFNHHMESNVNKKKISHSTMDENQGFNDTLNYGMSKLHMRESEIDLDGGQGMRNTLNQYMMQSMDWANPRDSVNPGGLSQIRSVNLNNFKLNKSRDDPPAFDSENADILYSVMSEYLLGHLEMKEYYVSRQTRERDIMKPFVIEQFFK